VLACLLKRERFPDSQKQMTALTPRQFWKPLALAAAVLFAYAMVLVKLGGQWWVDENYSHGLLIPFIIGYILWSERERLARSVQRPMLAWGGVCIVVALLMLWAGTAGAELFMQRTSLVVMLAGITLYFWGWHILRLMLVPLLLLALAIPIPAIIFNQIAFPLQLFASRCAVWAMRVFDIPVLRQGNVIELMPLNSTVTKKLEVVEACSGIRSLMTLLTLAVVFAYFTHPRNPDAQEGGVLASLKRYGTWRSAILVLSAVPIAIITNAGRVSGTGILAHYYGTEVADGFFHEFSGWVVYIAAFLLLFALGWVLDKFGARKPPQQKPPRKTAQANTATDTTGETPLGGAAAPVAVSLRERGAGGS
jgi:exosortase